MKVRELLSGMKITGISMMNSRLDEELSEITAMERIVTVSGLYKRKLGLKIMFTSFDNEIPEQFISILDMILKKFRGFVDITIHAGIIVSDKKEKMWVSIETAINSVMVVFEEGNVKIPAFNIATDVYRKEVIKSLEKVIEIGEENGFKMRDWERELLNDFIEVAGQV